MKADIDRGLRTDESCYLRLAPSDWERLGLSGEAQPGRNTSTGTIAARRFIRKYISSRGLSYTVRTVHREGFDYVIVDGA